MLKLIRRLRKWIGIDSGMTVVVPPGAILVLPYGATVDTLNVTGGIVKWTEAIEDETHVVTRTGGVIDWQSWKP